MRCRYCGGKTSIYRTVVGDFSTIRYRKCKECGETISTIEVDRYMLKSKIFNFVDNLLRETNDAI